MGGLGLMEILIILAVLVTPVLVIGVTLALILGSKRAKPASTQIPTNEVEAKELARSIRARLEKDGRAD